MGATVSFIIPAFRSGATLGRTLASIAAQSMNDWEAIVVHDGVGDPGRAVSTEWSKRDRRVSAFEQPHAGAARARNNAIARSSGEWLVFLDADDTLAPAFLRLMLGKARRRVAAGHPVDVVACGFDRRDESGRLTARVPALPLDEDPVAVCAAGPPGAIHSFLARRNVVIEAGGFDEELVTNEDWDLWLRIAQRGARFAVLDRQLAYYWSTPNSLSRAGGQMVRDAATVMERARASQRKPRRGLEAFDQRHVSAADLAVRNAFWSAGVAIGHGRSTDDLLAHLPPGANLGLQKTHLIDRLVDGLVVGSGIGYPQLAVSWPRFAGEVAMFLEGIAVRGACDRGERPGAEQSCFGLMELIQITIARYGRFSGAIDLGCVLAVMLGARNLLRGYDPPPHVDVVVLRLPWLRPATLFSFVLPALGHISGRDIVRAIRGETRRRLLNWLATQGGMTILLRVLRMLAIGRRVLRQVPLPRPIEAPSAVRRRTSDLTRVYSAALVQSDLPVRVPEPAKDVHPGAGSSAAAWERFFADEDPWNYGSDYEQQKYRRTLALIPPVPGQNALEIACAEGRFTELLAPQVGRLTALDISTTAIARAARRVARFGNVAFAQHDLFAGTLPAGGYDLITCSEVLYFAPCVAALARVAGQIAGALRPGGHFVHAHAYAIADTPERTGFDWGNAFGAGSIHAAFAAQPLLAHVRTTETELYRIDLFRRIEQGARRTQPVIDSAPSDTAIDPKIAADIVWDGAIRTRAEVARDRVYRLPVLALDRTGPKRLETLLRFLRRRGFRSVTPAELEEGAAKAASLRGRPVLLTAEWAGGRAEAIWPVIRRSGFLLHAFVATDGVSDWRALLALAEEGVSFGSALASGVAADTLNGAALIDEAVRSRCTLEHVLAAPVTTIAPIGLSDPRVEQLIAGAGYTRLFVEGAGLAGIALQPLQTPRIAINDALTLAEIAAMLGDNIEPPDAMDHDRTH
jgi:glycosyltransferase involved in cell wall biosynthesis/SAM-dependent methyltransferase